MAKRVRKKTEVNPERNPHLGWPIEYWEQLDICKEAFQRMLMYPNPLSAWNGWTKAEEMVWFLKRARADNRLLAKCLLEIFDKFFPGWQEKERQYPKYRILKQITSLRDYAAAKISLRAIQNRYPKLSRTLSEFPEEFNVIKNPKTAQDYIYGYIFENVLRIFRIITEDGYDFEPYLSFIKPVWWCGRINKKTGCPFDSGVREEEEQKWARDCIRRYFPDPETIMKKNILCRRKLKIR